MHAQADVGCGQWNLRFTFDVIGEQRRHGVGVFDGQRNGTDVVSTRHRAECIISRQNTLSNSEEKETKNQACKSKREGEREFVSKRDRTMYESRVGVEVPSRSR